MRTRNLRIGLTCSLLLAAFAAQAAPEDDLAEGQAAVINALVAGAEMHAPALLLNARHNLQAARDSLARKERERARRLARQAFDDATAAEYRALAVREARAGREPATGNP